MIKIKFNKCHLSDYRVVQCESNVRSDKLRTEELWSGEYICRQSIVSEVKPHLISALAEGG